MKITRFSLLAGIVLAIALTSCSILDKASEALNSIGNGLTSGNLFQNSAMGFQSSGTGVPDGDVSAIENVDISGSALAGGSVQITVTANQELEQLFFQIDGEDGYYIWTLKAEDQISSNPWVYQVVLELNQNPEDMEEGEQKEIEFIVSGRTKSGDIANPVEEELIVKNVGTGALQVSLSWDKLDDVDLYVYTPYGDRLFFGNRASENDLGGTGTLDVDSNAGCSQDGINSENIFFDKPLKNGNYIVVAHLYSKCTSGDGARFNVTVNGKLVTEKGQKFADEANGQGSSLGSAPTSSSTNVKLIGTAVVANGEYVDFIAAN